MSSFSQSKLSSLLLQLQTLELFDTIVQKGWVNFTWYFYILHKCPNRKGKNMMEYFNILILQHIQYDHKLSFQIILTKCFCNRQDNHIRIKNEIVMMRSIKRIKISFLYLSILSQWPFFPYWFHFFYDYLVKFVNGNHLGYIMLLILEILKHKNLAIVQNSVSETWWDPKLCNSTMHNHSIIIKYYQSLNYIIIRWTVNSYIW